MTSSITECAFQCASRHGLDVLGEAWLHAYDSHPLEAGRASRPETIAKVADAFVPLDEIGIAIPRKAHVPDIELHLCHDPEANLRRSGTKLALRRTLSRLTPREERVLRLLYDVGEATIHHRTSSGYTPNNDVHPGLTLKQVGDLLGVRPDRVAQIEAKALRKLRHPGSARHLRNLLDDPDTSHIEPLPLQLEERFRVSNGNTRFGTLYETAEEAVQAYLRTHPDIAECVALVEGPSDVERLRIVMADLPRHLDARNATKKQALDAERLRRETAELDALLKRNEGLQLAARIQREHAEAIAQRIRPICARYPELDVCLILTGQGFRSRFTVIARSPVRSSYDDGPPILSNESQHLTDFDAELLVRLDRDLSVFHAVRDESPYSRVNAPSSALDAVMTLANAGRMGFG